MLQRCGSNTGIPVFRQSFARNTRQALQVTSRRSHRKVGSVVQEQVNSLDDGTDILLRAGTAHTGLACGIRELPGEVQSDHQNGKLREHC